MIVSFLAYLIPLLQIALLITLAPLFGGIIAALRAGLESRPRPSVLAPYRALRKRWRRSFVRPREASFVHDLAPVGAFAAATAAVGLVPILTTTLPHGAGGGGIAFLGLFLLARWMQSLAVLDAGPPLSGVLVSRDLTLAVLAVPALLLSLATVSFSSRTGELGTIAARASAEAVLLTSPAWVLAGLALAMAAAMESAETSGVLASSEQAGARLAFLVLAADIRRITLWTLFVNLFLPWGLASRPDDALRLAMAAVTLVTRLLLVAFVLGVVEARAPTPTVERRAGILAAATVLAIVALALAVGASGARA